MTSKPTTENVLIEGTSVGVPLLYQVHHADVEITA